MSTAVVGMAVAAKEGQAGKSNVAHLYLYEKTGDPDWDIVEDGAWGKMKYNLAGPEFDFVFNGHGLAINTEYCLIYYADYEDRMNDWGGDNDGAFIASGTSNGGGNIHLADSIELNMDLPCDPDENIDTHDYSGAPDYYANAHGAKIWLVPCDDYSIEDRTIYPNWNLENYLFETDLIWYDDTDEDDCGWPE